MNARHVVVNSAKDLKRTVLMTILALAWVSSAAGWLLIEIHNKSSFVLRAVFSLNVLFHAVMLLIQWRRLLPQRYIDLSCLLFAAGICAACMGLRLYAPSYGASIDLQPLYLWIPIIYVFAFTVSNHQSSLRISLLILALFIALSLPYLLRHTDHPYSNFTLQLHMVSAVLISALYFFSSHAHRLQIAQLDLEELAFIANTDELTRLANRRHLAEAIANELLRFARYGHPFSIILIDIDHFKSVNDRFGHSVGDRVLVALSTRAMEMLRDVDTLGRWGGEEFIVILPETQFEETLHKASSLCSHVAASPLVDDYSITISCGVTTVREGDTADALIQRADAALYAAKAGGRNRAQGFPDVDAAMRS